MFLGLGQLCVTAGSHADHGQDGLKVREVCDLVLAAVGTWRRRLLAAAVEDLAEISSLSPFINLAK